MGSAKNLLVTMRSILSDMVSALCFGCLEPLLHDAGDHLIALIGDDRFTVVVVEGFAVFDDFFFTIPG